MPTRAVEGRKTSRHGVDLSINSSARLRLDALPLAGVGVGVVAPLAGSLPLMLLAHCLRGALNRCVYFFHSCNCHHSSTPTSFPAPPTQESHTQACGYRTIESQAALLPRTRAEPCCSVLCCSVLCYHRFINAPLAVCAAESTCENGYPGWQTNEACCSEFCGQCGGFCPLSRLAWLCMVA